MKVSGRRSAPIDDVDGRVRRRDLVLIHRIARKANETTHARDAVEFALERFARTQGWKVAHAFLLRRDPTPRYMPVPSLWRCAEPSRFRQFRKLTKGSGFAVGEGLIGEVGRQGEPRWLENVRVVRPPVRLTDEPLEVRSGLLVPVVHRTDAPAVCVLEFYTDDRRRRSRSRLDLAASVGALLARVFERERADRELAESREKEQRRIGQELHDTVSQELTGISFMAERLLEQLQAESSPLVARFRKLSEHIGHARARVHALSRGLLPVDVEEDGLQTALEYLADSTRSFHGIDCRVSCDEDLSAGSREVACQLAHIAQEALQNAAKHGNPQMVSISARRREGLLVLTVEDDGDGFSPREQRRGIGLRLMGHRARAIGAELSIRSRPGRGTLVRCECRI